jgi:hypothetical protein
MPINSFLYPGAKVTLGYEVANSLRFNSGDSPYLTRTISSGSDMTKFTFSFWCKRSTIGGDQRIYSNENTTAKQIYIRFNNNNTFTVYHQAGGSDVLSFDTNAVFRDVSAWYHFHFVMDSTQSTESNRFKMHVNGVQITDFNSPVYPSSNEAAAFLNTNEKSNIGYRDGSGGQHFDGYLTEVVLLQGVAEPYTSFGEFDEDSPTIWKPKDVSSLSRGTNGFYLDFEDSSSLGNDQGGSVNLTPNNLAATDQSTDTCTNNFATFNSLAPTTDITLSEGNLKGVYGTSGTRTVQTSTFGLSSGKWYWEIKIGGSTSPNNAMVGITQLSTDTNTVLGTADNSWAYRGYDGKVYHNNADEGGSLDTFTDGDIIGIALNLDNLQGSLHKLYFSKNGTFQNGADPTDFTSTTGVYGVDDNVDYFPAVSDAGSSATPQFEINFGSPSFSISSGNSDANGYGNFEYAVPSGFYAINSKNLAEFG